MVHVPVWRQSVTAQDRPEDADAGGRNREARDKVKAGRFMSGCSKIVFVRWCSY